MTDAAPPRVDDAVLDDLRARLRAWRRVEATGVGGWDRGTDPDWLADLVAHWADGYDWRVHEAAIAALPWVSAGGLRLVHQVAAAPDAVPVVLLHGWPDSVLRYQRVLPLLTDVHVVVPALPGYPFAAPYPERNLSSADMAEPVAAAMAELGHDRYVVSAGDIGRGVATALATRYADRVAALHLTDVPLPAAAEKVADESPAEQEYVAQARRWQQEEGAYLREQATKPHSLAVGLGDSPAGLAAWIVEKLRSWSDCGGDVESVFPRDDLLTWVTAYWTSGCIGTSFAPYAQRSPRFERIEVPTVVSQFPHELVRAPRSLAARMVDLRVWLEPEAGGHFAAWEQPEAFVAALREAVRLARQ